MTTADLIDPAEKVGDTTLTYADLVVIGQQLLNMVTAVHAMRHASPVGTADYAEPDDTLAAHIVHDFARWCGSDRKAGRRLVAFAMRSGWTNAVMQTTFETPETAA